MTNLDRLSAREWAARLERAGVAKALQDSLGRFLELLGKWSRVVDLTGRRDAEAVISEDVVGSLAGLTYLPAQGTLLDIGSGSGFPAVPLLLAAPLVRGSLLEPRERRWAFLQEAVRELGLSASVLREDVAAHSRRNFDVVTVRGVSEHSWVPEIPRLLAPGGSLLWWSGSGAVARAGKWAGGSVLTSAELPSGRSQLIVWRRCFT